jgi:hypothetical protein
MGQQEVSTSDNTTIKVTQLPKLVVDGENWLTYCERVTKAAAACGLCCHFAMLMLSPIVKKDGEFFLPSSTDTLEKHKSSVDSWEQKEAQVCELIYNTVDNSTFLQIKGEKMTAALWKKLSSIHRNKGTQFE